MSLYYISIVKEIDLIENMLIQISFLLDKIMQF